MRPRERRTSIPKQPAAWQPGPVFEDDGTREYLVVVNGEGQYSLWPLGKPIPAGWSDCGISGPKARCLDYIEQTWTDMRPRSLLEGRSDG
jgi:MbtH protein